MTKSPFVNRTIELIDVEVNNKHPADEQLNYVKEACVERIQSSWLIDQEDDATYVGTIELDQALYNLICAAHQATQIQLSEGCAYLEACEITMQQVRQVWQRERAELIMIYS